MTVVDIAWRLAVGLVVIRLCWLVVLYAVAHPDPMPGTLAWWRARKARRARAKLHPAYRVESGDVITVPPRKRAANGRGR